MGDYAWVIDVTLVLLILATTYVVSSEGLWGAALMFVNVMFAGLVTFCSYEWCAGQLDRMLPFMNDYRFSDFFCLIVLFSLTFTLLRMATDNLGYTMVRFPSWLHQIGRFVFGVATAWYFWAMFLCVLETAPIHKQFLGYQWQQHALWQAGLDRFWLGYVQSVTLNQFDWDPPRPFDAKSSFILRYHDYRPFGDPDPDMPGSKKKPLGGAPARAQAAPGQSPARPPATPGGAAGIAQPGR